MTTFSHRRLARSAPLRIAGIVVVADARRADARARARGRLSQGVDDRRVRALLDSRAEREEGRHHARRDSVSGDVRVSSFADVPGWTIEVTRDTAQRIIGAVWTGTLPPERFVELPFVGRESQDGDRDSLANHSDVRRR